MNRSHVVHDLNSTNLYTRRFAKQIDQSARPEHPRSFAHKKSVTASDEHQTKPLPKRIHFDRYHIGGSRDFFPITPI
jgi:hypothetical protein